VQVDPANVLRERGLRVTAQRVAVLRAVSGEPHVAADGVAARARTEIGAISVQAVYDALGALVDADLIRRIQPSGSPARFEARVGDNHHHVICRPVDDLGYQIDEAEVIYRGPVSRVCRCGPAEIQRSEGTVRRKKGVT